VPTLAIRLAIMVFAVLAVVVSRPDVLPADPWLQIWNRWDAPHFLEIAAHGYLPPADPARIVLLPLYPLAIAAGALVMAPIASAMLVSLLAGLAAAAGLHRLVRLDDSRPAARAAVVAMAIFPTAFAFVAPYSESLFVALAIWSFVRAREGDWRSAGLLGALAAFTRIQGILLLPALAVEYGLTRRRLDRDAAWVAVVGMGLVAYLALNYMAFGDALYFVRVQRDTFHVMNVAPWDALIDLWDNLWTSKPRNSGRPVAPWRPSLSDGASIWAVVSRRSRPSYAVCDRQSRGVPSLVWPISVPRCLRGTSRSSWPWGGAASAGRTGDRGQVRHAAQDVRDAVRHRALGVLGVVHEDRADGRPSLSPRRSATEVEAPNPPPKSRLIQGSDGGRPWRMVRRGWFRAGPRRHDPFPVSVPRVSRAQVSRARSGSRGSGSRGRARGRHAGAPAGSGPPRRCPMGG
jgi:hypothetical protein